MKNTQEQLTTMLDSFASGPPNYPPSGRLLFAMHARHQRSHAEALLVLPTAASQGTSTNPSPELAPFARPHWCEPAKSVASKVARAKPPATRGAPPFPPSLSPISGAVVLAVLGAGVISFSSVELPLHSQPLFRIDLRAKCLPPPCSVAHASSAPVTTVPFGHLQYNCDH